MELRPNRRKCPTWKMRPQGLKLWKKAEAAPQETSKPNAYKHFRMTTPTEFV